MEDTTSQPGPSLKLSSSSCNITQVPSAFGNWKEWVGPELGGDEEEVTNADKSFPVHPDIRLEPVAPLLFCSNHR